MRPPSSTSGEVGITGDLTDISVDDHGGIAFHNSTSAVHKPPLNGAHVPFRQNSLSSSHPSPQDDQRVKRDLILNANHQGQIEHYAIANSAVKINVPKETSLELLNYHWCWIHPLFLFLPARLHQKHGDGRLRLSRHPRPILLLRHSAQSYARSLRPDSSITTSISINISLRPTTGVQCQQPSQLQNSCRG
jgi:hypothetical protein